MEEGCPRCCIGMSTGGGPDMEELEASSGCIH